MLLKFKVSNYRSFKDEAVLDLEACSIKEQAENIVTAKSGSQPVNILKSIVLLGANSSGKSNLFKAFALMRHMVINSVKEIGQTKTYVIEPFLLSTETESSPSNFECSTMIDSVVYRYGFKANGNRIVAEWLYRIVKRREEPIFIRENDAYNILKSFTTDLKNKLHLLTEVVRPDALYLTVLSQFNIDFAQKLSIWFEKNNVYSDWNLNEAITYTRLLLADPEYSLLFNEILGKSDVGFTEVEALKKIDKNHIHKNINGASPRLFYQKTKVSHVKYNAKKKPVEKITLDLMSDESSGAQKLIALLGPIIDSLITGNTLWVDEFDAKIHPYIVSMVMSLFNSIKYNPNGAQLITISYNQQILKKLRRDQIVFLNKDDYGASSISALYIFNPHVRSNAIFDKEYLQGLYGGVPKIDRELRLKIKEIV